MFRIRVLPSAQRPAFHQVDHVDFSAPASWVPSLMGN